MTDGVPNEIHLTQEEADRLLQAPKRFKHPEQLPLPSPGIRRTFVLDLEESESGDGELLLDVNYTALRFSKWTHQLRVQRKIILARLDVGGAPHTNPDGQKLSGTHLHLYREGANDAWARPVRPDEFPHLADPRQTLLDFLVFCGIRGEG